MPERGATFEIRVQPGARRNEMVGLRDGVLYIKVTAPPRKGEANRALLELMARALAVPKDAVDIVRGHTSRSKVVAIRGLSTGELEGRLSQALAGKDAPA